MSVYTITRTAFGTDVVDPEGEHVEEHMSEARAALLADALNVHEATGLTPSQLQARVAELEAALADESEKAAFWASKAHEMRGQALRGEPVDGIIQP